jgi:hypothetical protein
MAARAVAMKLIDLFGGDGCVHPNVGGTSLLPEVTAAGQSVIVLRFRFAVKETSKAYAPASWPETCDAGFQR